MYIVLILIIILFIILYIHEGSSVIKKVLSRLLAFLLGLIPAIVILFSFMTDGMNKTGPIVISLSILSIIYLSLGYIYGYFGNEPHWQWSIALLIPGLFILFLVEYDLGLFLRKLLFLIPISLSYFGTLLGMYQSQLSNKKNNMSINK